jgi:MCP family monocarboxylic acid transporter-like MFS transporter 13/MCP family monocarboxylic acid transporter-like MFS transporter 12
MAGAEAKPHEEPDCSSCSYGWLVVFFSFWQHVVINGLNYSGGVLFDALLEEFGETRGATSWAASLNTAALLGGGVFSGLLITKIGQQRTVLLGGTMVISGFMLTSVAPNLPMVIATHGLLSGFGMCFAWQPCVIIIPQYFDKRRSTATGIAVSGAGVGTFVMSAFTRYLFAEIGWRNGMRLLGVLALVMSMATSAVFKPGPLYKPRPAAATGCLGLDASLLQNRLLRFVTVSLLACGLGYSPMFVHLVRHAKDLGIDDAKAVALIGYIGIGSMSGRVITGFMGDKVSPLGLYAGSVCLIGLADIALPFTTSYTLMSLIAVVFGWGGGSFIALIPVLLANWLGVARLPQAMGLLYTFQASTLLLGPPLVGWMYDAMGSYKVALIIVGAAEFVSAAAMVYVPRLVEAEESAREEAAQLEAKAGEELLPTPDAGAAAVEGGGAEAKPSLIPADVGAAKGAEDEASARP